MRGLLTGVICLGGLFGADARVSAQDAEEAKPRPSRIVRFLPVGDLPPFRQEIRDGVRYELEPDPGSIPPREVQVGFGEDEAEEGGAVPLLLGRVSEPLKAPGGAGPLLIRRRGEGDGAQPWLRVNRPEDGDFLVLLWRGDPAGSWEKARAMVLPDGPAAAPAGRMRVVNLSPVAVGVVFGGENIKLLPGKSYQRPVPVGKDTPIQLGAIDASGALRRFHAGAVFQNRGERTLVVIYRADGVEPRRPLKAVVHREPMPEEPRPAPANPGR